MEDARRLYEIESYLQVYYLYRKKEALKRLLNEGKRKRLGIEYPSKDCL